MGITGDVTHDFGTAGTYTIRIRGKFPSIYFNNSNDKLKILSVDNWGEIDWKTMQSAFDGCKNLHVYASDKPDLKSVTSMYKMFANCEVFNEDINRWDVSNITDMRLFNGAVSFNKDLNNWDTSNVTTMYGMFDGASVFNKDIGAWNTLQVRNMSTMFRNATVLIKT